MENEYLYDENFDIDQLNFLIDFTDFGIGFTIFKPVISNYKLGIGIDIAFFKFWVFFFKK